MGCDVIHYHIRLTNLKKYIPGITVNFQQKEIVYWGDGVLRILTGEDCGKTASVSSSPCLCASIGFFGGSVDEGGRDTGGTFAHSELALMSCLLGVY